MFKIALKKDEIELLQLLGAGNFYIKKPFLGEGLFFGFFAAAFAYAILLGIVFYLQPFLIAYFKELPKLTLSLYSYQIIVWPINTQFLAITFVLTAFFGMGIGFFASYLATEKYLS